MSLPRILFIGPGHNGSFRARIAPFVDRAPATVVSTEPLPVAWRRAHPRAAVRLLPRPLLRRLPRRLLVHTADYFLELWALVARFRPQVIHVHYVSQLDALALLPVRRTPIVLTVMGADVQEDQVPRPLPLDLAVRRLFRRAAAVTAKSEFLAARCRELGADDARIHHVPWGLDTTHWRPRPRDAARRALGLPAGVPLVVSSRTLAPLYNHEPILEAVAACPSPAPQLVFTRHAQDPAYAADIAARARELGVAAHFLPPLDPRQMPELYAAADVVVSLPVSDGLPQTMLEALACARPFLTLDLAAYRELPFASDAVSRCPHRAGAPLPGELGRRLQELLAPGPRPGLAAARAWIGEHAEFSRSVVRVEAIYRSVARS